MNYTSSEHARVLMAEALNLFASGLDQTRTEEFSEALTEAVESGKSDEIMSMLACSAVEAWARYAVAVGIPANEILRLVFANWEQAEHDWKAGGLPASMGEDRAAVPASGRGAGDPHPTGDTPPPALDDATE